MREFRWFHEMIDRLLQRWTLLHWASRMAMLVLVVAVLLWQSRYAWTLRNVPYGWPLAFDNIGKSLEFGYRS